MLRSLLSGLIAWCVGCVVPTPLEADAGSPTTPVIVKGEPFAFGPVTEDASKSWFLGGVAWDPNPDDLLTARLCVASGDECVRLSDDRVMTPLGDPSQREQKFSNRFCLLLGDVGVEKFVYLYVSNHLYPPPPTALPNTSPTGFPDPDLIGTLVPGTYDAKYWVVTCR